METIFLLHVHVQCTSQISTFSAKTKVKLKDIKIVSTNKTNNFDELSETNFYGFTLLSQNNNIFIGYTKKYYLILVFKSKFKLAFLSLMSKILPSYIFGFIFY